MHVPRALCMERFIPSTSLRLTSPQKVPVLTHLLLYTQRLSQHRQQNPEVSFVNMSELDPWLKTADATSYFEGLSETKALAMKG